MKYILSTLFSLLLCVGVFADLQKIPAKQVSVDTNDWTVLQPASNTVQAALDAIEDADFVDRTEYDAGTNVLRGESISDNVTLSNNIQVLIRSVTNTVVSNNNVSLAAVYSNVLVASNGARDGAYLDTLSYLRDTGSQFRAASKQAVYQYVTTPTLYSTNAARSWVQIDNMSTDSGNTTTLGESTIPLVSGGWYKPNVSGAYLFTYSGVWRGNVSVYFMKSTDGGTNLFNSEWAGSWSIDTGGGGDGAVAGGAVVYNMYTNGANQVGIFATGGGVGFTASSNYYSRFTCTYLGRSW